MLATIAVVLITNTTSRAQEPRVSPAAGVAETVAAIDLETTLRLVGAQNLDIQIAREKLAEAKANRLSAFEQFIPSAAPGILYRRHEGLTQATAGELVDVDKESDARGATIALQVEVGSAYFKTREAGRLAGAAEHALGAQRQASLLAAVEAYFDLAKTQAALAVAEEAVKIAVEYETQVRHAVDAGIAFKGDALRVQVQAERNRIAVQRAIEQRRAAAARLATLLDQSPSIDLLADDSELVPLSLIDPERSVDSLVADGLARRDEIHEQRARVAAARSARNGTLYGPLIPAVGGQAFLGSLSGGPDGGPEMDGSSRDYAASVSWRVGPGGLFDVGRVRSAGARLEATELAARRVATDVARQVVDIATRLRSLAEQMDIAERGLASAEDVLRLTRERKEFGVGAVLESIVAEQELTRTRTDYYETLAEFNKAQYALIRAVGGLNVVDAAE